MAQIFLQKIYVSTSELEGRVLVGVVEIMVAALISVLIIEV